MATHNKNSRTCDVIVFTAEELSAARSNEQAVCQKIEALQINPGDKLIIREYSHDGIVEARHEYIGKLLSSDENGFLEVLTCGKKVWSNGKNKRRVLYRDIEEIKIVNKA